MAVAPLPVLAQEPAPAAVSADEAKVRRIVANLEADQSDPHVSPMLDRENAFGIRYDNLKKRDAFSGLQVALRPAGPDGLFNVCYRSHIISQFNLADDLKAV